jgi:hypothetical protein
MGKSRSLVSNNPLGRRRSNGLEIKLMRNRSRGRRAAERAGFKVGMRPRMTMRHGMIMRPGLIMRSRMVMRMGGHARCRRRTELQRKRHAARRHEAGGNIGTKNQQGQQ